MVEPAAGEPAAGLVHRGLRIVRGMHGPERADLLGCWIELWKGAVHSQRRFIDVSVEMAGDSLRWCLVEGPTGTAARWLAGTKTV